MLGGVTNQNVCKSELIGVFITIFYKDLTVHTEKGDELSSEAEVAST